MHVSWFIPDVQKWPWQKSYNYDHVLASSWIRCLQLLPFLKDIGLNSKVNQWDSKTQIAIFLRRWNPKDQSLAKKLKKDGVKIVLDTPANYFSTQDLPALQGDNMDWFRSFADIADVIFCPSLFIEQFGRKLGYETICLEDSVNLKHFSSRKKDRKLSKKPVLIWSGVSVKADSLNFLAGPVKRNGWNVNIISDKRPELDFKYRFLKWRYNSFPKNILRGDIGIFPRKISNEYDMGHSFFKVGVFLVQHVPVVCTPLPSYKQVVTQENSVCIDRFDDEMWEQHILSIHTGKKKINFNNNPIQEFSTEKVAVKYLSIFKKLLQT